MTTTRRTFAPAAGGVPRSTPRHRRRKAPLLQRPATLALPLVAVGAATLAPWHRATPRAATTALTATLADATAPSGSDPGAVVGFGDAGSHGAPGTASGSVVGIARTPSGTGYWVATASGAVVGFGDAAGYGSLAGTALHSPIVGIAATPSGHGYWLVASDGGVFSFGDAGFHGSLGDLVLKSPITGIASTPSGAGYWLVAGDGGVFSFGDAGFHGSLGDQRLASPIVGMAATGSGSGYWLVAGDGGVFSFGDATFHGSLAGQRLARPVTAIAASPTGAGYWLASADGGVFAFGDALYNGSLSAEPASTAVVAIAPGTDDGGYWLATAPTPTAPSHTVTASSTGGTDLGAFTVTCYDNSGTTASGAHTSTATVAVDPSVIPLGTHIEIQGVGERIAQDTGGAVRGRHVDIWEPSAAACDQWGVQTREVSRL